MACFKVRQFDGQDWIYNPKLLSVMEDQSKKYRRRSGSSPRQLEVINPLDTKLQRLGFVRVHLDVPNKQVVATCDHSVQHLVKLYAGDDVLCFFLCDHS